MKNMIQNFLLKQALPDLVRKYDIRFDGNTVILRNKETSEILEYRLELVRVN